MEFYVFLKSIGDAFIHWRYKLVKCLKKNATSSQIFFMELFERIKHVKKHVGNRLKLYGNPQIRSHHSPGPKRITQLTRIQMGHTTHLPGSRWINKLWIKMDHSTIPDPD